MVINLAYLQESSQSPLTSPVVDLPRASDPGQLPRVSIVLIPASVESHHAAKNKRSKWIETGRVVVYSYSLSLSVSLATVLLLGICD